MARAGSAAERLPNAAKQGCLPARIPDLEPRRPCLVEMAAISSTRAGNRAALPAVLAAIYGEPSTRAAVFSMRAAHCSAWAGDNVEMSAERAAGSPGNMAKLANDVELLPVHAEEIAGLAVCFRGNVEMSPVNAEEDGGLVEMYASRSARIWSFSALPPYFSARTGDRAASLAVFSAVCESGSASAVDSLASREDSSTLRR